MPTATAPAERAAPRRARAAFAAANRPVAAESAAVFRVTFGLLACFGALRFLARGWVDALYLRPEHHLTFVGFEWVHPWPGPLMHLHVLALAGLGLCIALGYHHRAAAALFTAGFAYVELIDASLYLNHYWYVTLAGVLLTLLPVHHFWSLDARAGRVVWSPTVPVVTVWALRAQLAVVYCFAGLAKLNPDWLLHAQPMRLWLADRTTVPVVGSLLDTPALAFAASWAGAAFDCTIVALLCRRRTRPFAYAAVVAFHLATGALFQIGVFPWVMIAGTLVFFEPDWPSRLVAHLGRGRRAKRPDAQPVAPLRVGTALLVALIALAAVEIAIPLRHYLYPGNVRWTEEGYYFSWRVMLTEKAGFLEFRVTDPAAARMWVVGPELVLTDWQAAQAAIRPDLLHATAHLIADHYRADGIPGVEVRADAFVAMNGRPARRLVDPDVDLAARPRSLAPASWILPAGSASR